MACSLDVDDIVPAAGFVGDDDQDDALCAACGGSCAAGQPCKLLSRASGGSRSFVQDRAAFFNAQQAAPPRDSLAGWAKDPLELLQHPEGDEDASPEASSALHCVYCTDLAPWISYKTLRITPHTTTHQIIDDIVRRHNLPFDPHDYCIVKTRVSRPQRLGLVSAPRILAQDECPFLGHNSSRERLEIRKLSDALDELGSNRKAQKILRARQRASMNMSKPAPHAVEVANDTHFLVNITDFSLKKEKAHLALPPGVTLFGSSRFRHVRGYALPHHQLRKRHAAVIVESGTVVLVPLSKQLVLVDGQEVLQPIVLNDNSTVTLGDVTFRFRYAPKASHRGGEALADRSMMMMNTSLDAADCSMMSIGSSPGTPNQSFAFDGRTSPGFGTPDIKLKPPRRDSTSQWDEWGRNILGQMQAHSLNATLSSPVQPRRPVHNDSGVSTFNGSSQAIHHLDVGGSSSGSQHDDDAHLTTSEASPPRVSTHAIGGSSLAVEQSIPRPIVPVPRRLEVIKDTPAHIPIHARTPLRSRPIKFQAQSSSMAQRNWLHSTALEAAREKLARPLETRAKSESDLLESDALDLTLDISKEFNRSHSESDLLAEASLDSFLAKDVFGVRMEEYRPTGAQVPHETLCDLAQQWQSAVTTVLKRSGCRLIDLFNRFDSDSDGYMTRNDIFAGARALHLAVGPHEANALFTHLDLDRDGRIDFAEFCKAAKSALASSLRRPVANIPSLGKSLRAKQPQTSLPRKSKASSATPRTSSALSGAAPRIKTKKSSFRVFSRASQEDLQEDAARLERTKRPSTWTVDDVVLWLRSQKLGSVARRFRASHVNGAELVRLDYVTLRDLSLNKGEAIDLEKRIADLRRRAASKGPRTVSSGNSLQVSSTATDDKRQGRAILAPIDANAEALSPAQRAWKAVRRTLPTNPGAQPRVLLTTSPRGPRRRLSSALRPALWEASC
eukprot:m.290911 g.290911  ORF g.290911 m.290911 type:complete len:955 (+) comp12377_c0_seq1:116-2980(+)